MDKILMTVKDAAEYLSVSVSTFRRSIEPALKGKRIIFSEKCFRYKRSDVDAYVQGIKVS